jgi:two-component system, OmpR family, phosphate regulon response regulator PhoB
MWRDALVNLMRSPMLNPNDFRQECILLADADAALTEAILRSLVQEGYRAQATALGLNVLDILDTAVTLDQSAPHGDPPPFVPDLLILDTALPDMNGLDVCRQLRQQRYGLPILMTSTKSSELDRVVGLEVGADDYLIKPYGIRELVARCRALLRRRQRPTAPAEATLSFQDLVLYPDSCQVTRNGENLALSPKEFRLLELLMRHPRRVWNRDQLLERVWGQDFVGDTKTVDVHIRWLREKIELDPSQPQYIQTVRGFGYRLG